MGLFTAATLKAHQPEPEEPRERAEPPLVKPSGAATATAFTTAPELENSLDSLWSRLRLTRRGTDHQCFAITHWEPQQGATTIATALAHRAAQVDPASSFCLVDFDVFEAGLSFLTELEAEPGVSNILLGQASLEESLAATALPNLTIVPAGYPTIGRSVTELFDRCLELCESLGERFHYVLLDLPSLRQHANFAYWMNGFAQALLVVRAGRARRPAVAKAIASLQLMRLDLAAIVLNAREYYVPKWLYART